MTPSRMEPAASSSREFKDDAPPRVVEAAERVLRNLYRKDLSISRTANGFVAERPRDPHAVVSASNEQWQFRAIAAPPRGSRATVELSGLGAQMGPSISQGDVGLRIGQALSRLFWARVGYVLGRGEPWLSCRQAFEDEAKATGEDYSAVCEMLADATDTQPAPRLDR